MSTRITAWVEHVRVWLAAWWTYRRAPAVVADYRDALKTHRLMMADLSRFCLANDDTFTAGQPDQSAFDQGKRSVWLHIQALSGATNEDLHSLKRETEIDDGGE